LACRKKILAEIVKLLIILGKCVLEFQLRVCILKIFHIVTIYAKNIIGNQQPGHDSLKRTVRTELQEQNCHDITTRTRLPGQDSRDGTIRTALSGRNCQERTASTGRQDRTDGKENYRAYCVRFMRQSCSKSHLTQWDMNLATIVCVLHMIKHVYCKSWYYPV
jgi:hypothetical protein